MIEHRGWIAQGVSCLKNTDGGVDGSLDQAFNNSSVSSPGWQSLMKFRSHDSRIEAVVTTREFALYNNNAYSGLWLPLSRWIALIDRFWTLVMESIEWPAMSDLPESTMHGLSQMDKYHQTPPGWLLDNQSHWKLHVGTNVLSTKSDCSESPSSST